MLNKKSGLFIKQLVAGMKEDSKYWENTSIWWKSNWKHLQALMNDTFEAVNKKKRWREREKSANQSFAGIFTTHKNPRGSNYHKCENQQTQDNMLNCPRCQTVVSTSMGCSMIWAGNIAKKKERKTPMSVGDTLWCSGCQFCFTYLKVFFKNWERWRWAEGTSWSSIMTLTEILRLWMNTICCCDDKLLHFP